LVHIRDNDFLWWMWRFLVEVLEKIAKLSLLKIETGLIFAGDFDVFV